MPALSKQVLRMLLALPALAVAPLSAGIDSWTQIAPPGGDPGCVAVSPSSPGVVYLGCSQGIFRSDDGGAHWRQRGLLVGATGLIVDPQDAETLYASILKGDVVDDEVLGVMMSTDGGATWKPADRGLEPSPAGSFVTPNVVAVAAGHLLAGSDNGIYESLDGGASWRFQSLAGVCILSLAVDSSDGGHWLANTGDVLETFDAGKSWSSTNYSFATPVQVLPAGRNLYAIGYAGPVSRRIGDRPWEAMPSLPQSAFANALDVSPQGVVYLATNLGVYRSVDGGAAWQSGTGSGTGGTARPLDFLVDVKVLPGAPAAVLTSGYAGMWRSEDAGTTWQPSSAGIYGNAIDAVAVAPDSTVYAAVSLQGIFRSRDGGMTWQKRSHGLHLDPPTAAVDGAYEVSDLATDPHDPARVFAAFRFNGSGLVAETTDAGDTWHYLNLPADTSIVRSLQVDPVSRSLYAIADSAVGMQLTSLLRSSDDGKKWSPLLVEFDILSLGIDPLRPTTLYAGTIHRLKEGAEDRFLKSEDGGRTWRLAGHGLPEPAVWALAVDPQNPRRIYAGAAGVYVSSNGGDSFQPMNRGLPADTFAARLIVDPRNPSVLYLLDVYDGVFRWLPEAETWTPINEGLPLQLHDPGTSLLSIDPTRSDVLYAGGTRGLFQFTLR